MREPALLRSPLLVASAALAVGLVLGAPAAGRAWTFTDVTTAAGLVYQHGYTSLATRQAQLIAGGVAAGDYDRDGDVDLYVVRGSIGANLLFRNRGDGTFEERGVAAGVALTGTEGSGPTFADVDGDGWLDLLVLGVGATRPTLFRNLANGTFQNVTAGSGLVFTRDSISAAFGDYDRDGDLDLFVTHWADQPVPSGPREHLWRNDGGFHFTEVGIPLGVVIENPFGQPETTFDFTFTPNFVDLDADGWLDLAISSDFITSQVFHNLGGSFVDVTDRAVITDEDGMGGAIADVDRDGDLDWFVSSIFVPSGNTGNRLYRNRGDGTLEDATTAAGVRQGDWGWGSTFADVDNDGWVDLFHVTGYGNTNFPEWAPFYANPARLFVNDGDGTFTERGAELGVADTSRGLGVVAFDYDRDGDLDLFVANNEGAPKLFRNDGGNAFNRLTVKLHGTAPNTEAIGARIEVTSGGLGQLRELRAGSNYVSQDPAEAHFGLGTAPVADTVVVRWPYGGTTTLTNVAANQRLELTEPVGHCGNGVVETGPLYGEDCDLGAANGTPGACCQVNCRFRPSSYVCRGAAFACDAPETCTGDSIACPADVKSTGVCRPAAGPCDVAESCDGVAEACPPDLKRSGDVCRAANGVCDVAESCDGVQNACPPDGFADTSVTCRAAGDVCDVAETCSGTGPTCPDDGFAAPSVVCRPAATMCDAAEHCNGIAPECPADVLSTDVCRPAAGPCDVAESCDGVGLACPPDAFRDGGTVCRANADACDTSGVCDGVSAACPPNGVEPAGTPCQNDGNPCTVDACDGSGACTHSAGNAGTFCRVGQGACDPPEHCDGVQPTCPADELAVAGTVCRAAAGGCDVAESCTGSDVDCPADVLEPPTTVCRSSLGVCDPAEACTGSDPGCPEDAFAPPTTVCRAAADACDVAETCTGGAIDCPADGIAAAGTLCRAPVSGCDAAETCDGAGIACPADALAADGTPCSDGVLCNRDACVAGTCAGTRERACLDDFLCYRARRTAGTSSFLPVLLADRFEEGLFDVRASRQLCSPGAPDGDPVHDPATHLQSFQIASDDGTRHVPQTAIAVANRLGTLQLDTRKVDLLLVPTAIDGGGAPDPDLHGIDHFKCYQVRVTPQTPRFPRGVTQTMTDGFTQPAKPYQVVKPRHLCTPVAADGSPIRDPRRHLVCYVAKPARGAPKHVKRLVPADNLLGAQTVTTQKEEALCLPTTLAVDPAGPSVARQWDEDILDAIRLDIPRPTVHARNLYHLSAVMWDAWRAYGGGGRPILTDESHVSDDPEADRAVAISFAAYRILSHRYALSVNAAASQAIFDARMAALGLDPSYVDTVGDNPAAVGNRIAAAMIAFGATDGANEQGNYFDPTYTAANAPLTVKLPGTTMVAPNRWQPLALDVQVTQNGIPLPGGVQGVIGMNWNDVVPFALTRANPGDLYIDPGAPPLFGTATQAAFQAEALAVLQRANELTPDDGILMDASPGGIGNNPLGTNDGTGHPVNPITGEPYAPQIVPRGDFGRVLAEFWADGPHSETPPGHWNTLANDVTDRLVEKRLGGTGPIVSDLEWDVKMYLALNGAVHDAAIVAWGVKRHYDSARPISMIRYMGGLGQSSDPDGPAYHPGGLPLLPGVVEVVTAETSAPGQRHAGLAGFEGQVAVRTWPGSPADPANEHSGVRWLRAVSWVPYQRATFVTPAFPGYVSGHSTFSRAAAEVMTRLTGSPYFPGGLGEYVAAANEFLTFERGPTVDVHLQWATYYDAADQAGQSRIWGGIHIEADDFSGRVSGAAAGIGAWEKAERIFAGVPDP